MGGLGIHILIDETFCMLLMGYDTNKVTGYKND